MKKNCYEENKEWINNGFTKEDNGKVWEWCPRCETEVYIIKDSVSDCPCCGNQILPCSMCIDCISTSTYCPVWKTGEKIETPKEEKFEITSIQIEGKNIDYSFIVEAE